MTDQDAPDVTDEDRRLARKWAAHIIRTPRTSLPIDLAAARVILHAVPAAPRPTLADMTLDEQDECAGMQADLAQGDRVVILDGTPDSDDSVQVLEMNLGVFRPRPADVTPRPDLPRMTWPGDTPVAPDHLAVGTVIESADDPRIDALPLGTILLDRNEEATTKRPQPWGWTGLGNTPAEEEGDEPGPWTVLHIPKEADQ